MEGSTTTPLIENFAFTSMPYDKVLEIRGESDEYTGG